MINYPIYYKVFSLNKLRNQFGFTLPELMITAAIFAIAATVATPSITKQLQAYRLKAASTDLASYIQMAKAKSAKENEQWIINFEPVGYIGYEILDGSGNIVKSISFEVCDDGIRQYDQCYNSHISYKNPQGGTAYASPTITFFPNGLATGGSVSLTNAHKTRYYQISLLPASGVMQVKVWKDNDWK